ncbi:hypothetical protein [Streptomyces sp. XY006]|uniref:hypothetical protein n=1 Tax=Streptomyces sp. XY006 TaxID=2021410 RepID=UPI000B8C53B1|nr:hypothetical protein [Streptomyces sp. XY006]OXS35402.1 hypothetical protein CHR28_10365 [Streptomyces sp. XY006]
MPSLFRRHPTRTITDTVNGIPVDYDIPDTTPAPPRLPFNLDSLLRKALFTAAILMTIGAIVWGTVAIGSMLSLLAPAWAAYLVAGVFDAGWAACLVAEWLLRYDSNRAELPRRAGIAMLAVSVAAIILHGHRDNALLVGIVGALVSVAAKGVWAIGMHTIRIKLDPKYEAYLRALQQQAGTEMALALGERDRLLAEERTVGVRLALEARRPAAPPVVEPVNRPADRTVDRPEPQPVQAADQPVDQIETTPEPVLIQATGRAVDRPVRPEDQVDELFRRLRNGDHITKKGAATILGVPESTAYRRLKDAESKLHQYR